MKDVRNNNDYEIRNDLIYNTNETQWSFVELLKKRFEYIVGGQL